MYDSNRNGEIESVGKVLERIFGDRRKRIIRGRLCDRVNESFDRLYDLLEESGVGYLLGDFFDFKSELEEGYLPPAMTIYNYIEWLRDREIKNIIYHGITLVRNSYDVIELIDVKRLPFILKKILASLTSERGQIRID